MACILHAQRVVVGAAASALPFLALPTPTLTLMSLEYYNNSTIIIVLLL